MKHLKKFENNGYKNGPQVGDYVIIEQEPNNIGVISKISISFNDGTDEEFEYDINYSDLEDGDIISYHVYFFTKTEDYFYIIVGTQGVPDIIIDYSDNKSDLNIKLTSNKYNL